MAEIKDSLKMNSNIIVDKGLDTKYKDVILFPEKLQRARDHFHNRDMKKEIDAALKKEKIMKL